MRGNFPGRKLSVGEIFRGRGFFEELNFPLRGRGLPRTG
jgi:hypothetical protein